MRNLFLLFVSFFSIGHATLPTATVAPAKNFIYLGTISFNFGPFTPTVENHYLGTYAATISTFSSFHQAGQIYLPITPQQLEQLANLEPIEVYGTVGTKTDTTYKLRLNITPTDALHGKLQIRVYVTAAIGLNFKTTYVWDQPFTSPVSQSKPTPVVEPPRSN